MENVLTIILYATKFLIALMNLTNLFIVMWMNVLKLKYINAVINVSTHQLDTIVNVILATNYFKTEKHVRILTNVLKHLKFVHNFAQTHQEVTIVNVTICSMIVNLTNIRVNDVIKLNPGLYLRTNTTSEICLSMQKFII